MEALKSTLENSVSIPIKLPTTLNLFVTPKDKKVYVRVGGIRPEIYSNDTIEKQYSGIIENQKMCGGNRNCLLGVVSGSSKMSEEFEDDGSQAEIIKLDTGIKGYYLKGVCGVNCSLDILMWKQNGFYYEVRGANFTSLKQTANQMIKNKPI